jgi:TM2 domain-containing membrane protein YozV
LALKVASFVLFLSILANCVESSEVRLISPIGAVSRSVIPGWGQFYTHSKMKGIIVFLSVGILGVGGVQVDATYRDYYNKYRDAVFNDSGQADFYFDRSNQYYKLSRFLLYTAAGIWAYSIIDSYVDAHIYNARQQSKMLDIDDERLQQLKTDSEPTAKRYYEDFDLLIDTPEETEASFSFPLRTNPALASTFAFQRYRDNYKR